MHHQHHLAGAMSDDALHDTSTSTLGPARGGAGRSAQILGDIFRCNYPPAAVSVSHPGGFTPKILDPGEGRIYRTVQPASTMFREIIWV